MSRAGAPATVAASLLRHRWLTAAGMTATIAAMAGGGLLLARHETRGGQAGNCGLVPCTATLPPSATSGAPGREQPATSPSPRAHRPAAALAGPPSGAGGDGPAAPGPGPAAGRVSWAAGQGRSADHGIGVGYEISRGPGGIVQGRIVILDRGPAPVTGWRLRLVLPGDRHYQVINARNIPAGDSLVVQPGAGQGTLSPGRFELVTFTAQGASNAPVSCQVEDAAGLPARAAAAGGLRGAGTGSPASADPGQPRGGRGDWPGAGRGWGGHGGGWGGHGGGWGGHGGGWGGGGWGAGGAAEAGAAEAGAAEAGAAEAGDTAAGPVPGRAADGPAGGERGGPATPEGGPAPGAAAGQRQYPVPVRFQP